MLGGESRECLGREQRMLGKTERTESAGREQRVLGERRECAGKDSAGRENRESWEREQSAGRENRVLGERTECWER